MRSSLRCAPSMDSEISSDSIVWTSWFTGPDELDPLIGTTVPYPNGHSYDGRLAIGVVQQGVIETISMSDGTKRASVDSC